MFCNPPYGKEIINWVRKAYEESRDGKTLIVMLIPARTDTQWFHKYVYHSAEIRFIEGRLHFGHAKNPAPFPSMIAIYNNDTMNNTTLQDVSPAIETRKDAEEKQEFRFVGNMRRVPGHTLFEFNTVTHELRQADIDHDVSVGLNGDVIHKTRVSAKKDCIYFQALNRENAYKKLIKMYHLREHAQQSKTE